MSILVYEWKLFTFSCTENRERVMQNANKRNCSTFSILEKLENERDSFMKIIYAGFCIHIASIAFNSINKEIFCSIHVVCCVFQYKTVHNTVIAAYEFLLHNCCKADGGC